MLRKAVLLILITLLSGCSVLGNPMPGGPASTDQEAGGGVVATEEALVGGGQATPTAAGESAPAAAATAAPLALPGIELPQVKPGETIQRGGQTLRLVKVLIELDSTVIEVEVQGLGSDYVSAQPTGAPLLILPNGAQMKATGADGTGSPGTEKTSYVFPALPAGTTSFHLLIENHWSGAVETWRIPVVLLE